MDLRSENPFWLLNNGILNTYPSLHNNLQTDIAIIGAGITGALVGWHLARAGFSLTIIDKAHPGMESTAASTSLLQYEIDTPLTELIKKVGQKVATRSYIACADAILTLENICSRFPEKSGFHRRPSLQLASYKSHVKQLNEEYRIRKQTGFEVEFWSAEHLNKNISIDGHAALFSSLGAELDAYRLTHHLLKECQEAGTQVYSNTEISTIRHNKAGITLRTNFNNTISCNHLIIACGYASQNFIPKKVDTLHSTYAMVSEPISENTLWYKKCLIWETAQPYLYLRTTPANRVIIGGLDDSFYSPEKRDRQVNKKAARLLQLFNKLFPQIPFYPDFKWAGTFAATKDGLPYIGSIPQRPNTTFALGFGGNGITFSQIAAELITSRLEGKKHPYNNLFGFNR